MENMCAYIYNEVFFYLHEVYLCDPKCIALDFVKTYKVFLRSLLDISMVVPGQKLAPFHPTRWKLSQSSKCGQPNTAFGVDIY